MRLKFRGTWKTSEERFKEILHDVWRFALFNRPEDNVWSQKDTAISWKLSGFAGRLGGSGRSRRSHDFRWRPTFIAWFRFMARIFYVFSWKSSIMHRKRIGFIIRNWHLYPSTSPSFDSFFHQPAQHHTKHQKRPTSSKQNRKTKKFVKKFINKTEHNGCLT